MSNKKWPIKERLDIIDKPDAYAGIVYQEILLNKRVFVEQKHDALFNPKRQERIYKYIAKKSKVTVVKCDAEHNLFLSDSTFHILEVIKEYVVKICSEK